MGQELVKLGMLQDKGLVVFLGALGLWDRGS